MTNTDTTTPQQVVETYFDAWLGHDFDRLRSILADDVSFVGSMGVVDGGDECASSMAKLAEIITDLHVQHRWVDGTDVITWFDMHTKIAPPTPVANWSRVEDGRITRIRVTFDPRGMLGPPDS
jgi:ketosteroid isomerase-like protein